MDYHTFIGRVQHRTRLGTFEEAVRATRATLETLGERLYGGEPSNLGAQLPEELGHYLERAKAGEAFDLDEFLNRVQIREGVDLPEAVFHARVVLQVLREAVSPSLMRKVLDQLPPEYDRFIGEAIHTSFEGPSGPDVEQREGPGSRPGGGPSTSQGGPGGLPF